MSIRDEYNPGDLSVRLSFPRASGPGLIDDRVCPTLSITCQTSGLTLELDLTPAQLAEMLGSGSAQVAAKSVTGFAGVRDWGKRAKVITRTVDTASGDYSAKAPASLPHVAPVIADMRADGWQVEAPRRNNSGKWVLVGRKYTDEKED